MNTRKLSRRSAIAQSGLLVGAAVVGQKFAGAQESATRKASQNPSARETHGPFRFCLNTATIRGQKLGIVKEIEVAAQAGYNGIEPWVDAIETYVKNGGAPRSGRENA